MISDSRARLLHFYPNAGIASIAGIVAINAAIGAREDWAGHHPRAAVCRNLSLVYCVQTFTRAETSAPGF
jgi:hypothetical protein